MREKCLLFLPLPPPFVPPPLFFLSFLFYPYIYLLTGTLNLFRVFGMIGNHRCLLVRVEFGSCRWIFTYLGFFPSTNIRHSALLHPCSVRTRLNKQWAVWEPYRMSCKQVNMMPPTLILRAMLLLLLLYKTGKVDRSLISERDVLCTAWLVCFRKIQSSHSNAFIDSMVQTC